MEGSALDRALRAAARKVLPRGAKKAASRWYSRLLHGKPNSHGHEILEGAPPPEVATGWQDESIPERQRRELKPLLKALHEGRPRADFAAIAEAVRATGLEDPLIVEIGCSSGHNFEVLETLLHRRLRYIGMDFSPAMVHTGRRHYPGTPFAAADHTAIPLKDGACEVLVSGGVLQHVPEYVAAIRESRRVASRWCVFHNTPVTATRPTTLMKKLGYGAEVPEIVFNETELLGILEENGLTVERVLETFEYDLSDVIGEKTRNRTYVCCIRDAPSAPTTRIHPTRNDPHETPARDPHVLP